MSYHAWIGVHAAPRTLCLGQDEKCIAHLVLTEDREYAPRPPAPCHKLMYAAIRACPLLLLTVHTRPHTRAHPPQTAAHARPQALPRRR
jgi:hypothetical protein